MSGNWSDGRQGLARRRRRDRWFRRICALVTLSSCLVLALLLAGVVGDGWSGLSWDFIKNFPSRFPARAGIHAALVGSAWLIGLTAAGAIPVGVAAAVYLEEYARPGRIATFLEINIANLAGVPSIIYGLLGLALFVRTLALGRSVLAGALTMSLLVLPVIIMVTREALRAVPQSLRRASYALGATRWQTVRHHVVLAALPGIMTGIILALARALGETAPLIMIGALTYVAFVPTGPLDGFTVLPIQIFNWASRPQAGFHVLAASGSIVLLVFLLCMNLVAVRIRSRSNWRRS